MSNNRFYGQKGNSWRENMNTIMLNDGVWGDLKYTFNGNTYVIPAKHLASKGRTDICINACKTNNTELINKMGIKVVGG
jgi:hypothetical protein